MTTSSLLRDRRAVVFGGAGSIGAAVARELAAEGAEVFLSGRTASSVDLVAEQIREAGGQAHGQVLDALDEVAVDTIDAMVAMGGVTRDEAVAAIAHGRLLPASPHTADTARAVAFLASDRSAKMTGTVLNSSAGVVAD